MKYFICKAVACLKAFSVFSISLIAFFHSHLQAQVQPTTLVGNTLSEFDVTYGGAASYKVPVMVPAGAADLQLSVSLNYNSQFGNGVMGLGWQLATGLARIEDCYRRNTNQIIPCLNGEELVSVGGDYYRTEIDSGVLIHAVNSTTYELQFENGDTKTLTRQLTSPNVFLETQHTQRGGASYTVNWLVDTTNREPLVDSITYQGNEIDFIYETRNDRRTGYWMGSPRNLTQRLDSVIARVDGAVYRQYNVHYEYDSVSSLSKVMDIQECVGSGECLGALTFGWTDSGSLGFQYSDASLSGRIHGLVNLNNDGRLDRNHREDSSRTSHLYSDLDGDGRDEHITFSNYPFDDSPEATLNTIGLTYRMRGLDVERFLEDLNGDGKKEVVFRSGEDDFIGTRYFLSPNNYDSMPSEPRVCYPQMHMSDMNGDGLPDIIYNAHNQITDGTDCRLTEYYKVYLNQGNYSFSNSGFDLNFPDLHSRLQTFPNSRFLDINGDGLSDLLHTLPSDSRWRYRISLGNNTFSDSRILSTQRDSPIKYYLLDINADGLLDYIQRDARVKINMGDGTFSDFRTLESFVHHDYGGWYVGDFNGDGTEDIVRAPNIHEGRHVVWPGTSQHPYIQTFTDSNGNQHEVEYSKLTDADVYTRDSYDDGIDFGDTQPYQQALTVVKSLTTPNNQVFYKYAGARMHNGEHGYLGFKSITSVLAKEDQNGTPHSLVTVSYLNQTFPLVGKLTTVKKKVYEGAASTLVNDITYANGEDDYLIAMLNGVPVGAASTSEFADNIGRRGEGGEATGTDFSGQMNSYFDWQHLELGSGIYKPYLAEKVVDHLQLSDDALIKTERSESTWVVSGSGLYARLMASTNGTYNAAGVLLQEQQADITYEHTDTYGAPEAFLVNTSDTVTRLYDGNALADTHTLESEYDYYSNGLVQYQWLNRSDDGSDGKGTRTHYQYDSYGNQSAMTLEALSANAERSEMARSSSRSYLNGKYLSADTNSLGHQSVYQNYNVHGLPETMIDPSGAETTTRYDALGRVTQVTDHLGNDHYTYRGFCSDNGLGCTNSAYTWEHTVPAGGSQSYTWWDRKGQVVKTAKQSLQPGQWIVQAMEYDQYGRETRTSVPVIQSLATTVSFTNNSDRAFTEQTYDELNRVVRKQLPGVNRVVEKDYSNELAVVTTDPAGRITRSISNVLGQVTRKVQPDDTDVRFTYNAQGLVTHQDYPRLDTSGNLLPGQYHQVVNQYDRYGNQTSLDDPNQGQWTYRYNAFGELIQQTDARNQSTYFTYDALGRMRSQRDSETYSVWAYDEEEIGLIDTVSQYRIDSLSASAQAALTPDNVAATSGVTLAWQQDTDHDTTSKLPERVETTQRNRTGSLVTSVATTQYDDYGRVDTATLPTLYQNQGSLSAPRITYGYSDSGYLNRISDADSDTVYQDVESIDAFGNITGQTLAGNVELYRGYQPTTGWASDLQASNNSGLIIDQSYGNYNALGHIGSRDDASYYNNGTDIQAWSDTFGYNDALGQQLTDAHTQYTQNIAGVELDMVWNHRYTYDPLGNKRTQGISYSDGELPRPAPTASETTLVAQHLEDRLVPLGYSLSNSQPLLQGDLLNSISHSSGSNTLDTSVFASPAPETFTLQTGLLDIDGEGDPAPSAALTMRDLNGVSYVDGLLTKTVANSWGNGLFDTNETLAANTDGWLAFTVNEVDTTIAIGFADAAVAVDNKHKSILHKVWMDSNGRIHVHENNSWRGTLTNSAQSGDVVRIERTSGTLSYLLNGVVRYTSTLETTGALRPKGFFYHQNATISNLVSSFNSEGTAPPPEPPEPTETSEFTLRDLNGVSVDDEGVFTKTVANSWGNGLFDTNETLAANTDGWLEFTVRESDTIRAVGFADAASPIDNRHKSILYKVWMDSNGRIHVHENNSWRGTLTNNAQSGDVVRIERTGTTLRYLLNGVVRYTSSVTSTEALRPKGFFYTQGASIENLTASFLSESGNEGEPPENSGPYYVIDSTDWADLARTLYTSDTVAEPLRAALNNPTLVIGQRLSNLPQDLTQPAPPASYTIPSGSSWESLARTLYNTSDEIVDQSRNPYTGSDNTIAFHYANTAAPSQLTSTTGDLTRSYSYDANGNSRSDGTKTLTYNAWNKVATLTQGSNNTRFEYGPDRKRYLRVDQQGTSVTETLYVGDGYERVTTIQGSATVQHKYHLHGIALITQTESANTETTHSMISDYQDTVLAIADDSGNLIQRFRYTPYGEQVEVSQGITGSQTLTTKGYTSHEHIQDMDIIHMNGRIYDPILGRMLQSDPIVQAPEFVLNYNRYAYVWNNPMNLIDPTGYEVDDNGETFDTNSDSYGWDSGELQADLSISFASDTNIYGNDKGWGLDNPDNKLALDAFNYSLLDDTSTSYASDIKDNIRSNGFLDVASAFANVFSWQGIEDPIRNGIRAGLSLQPWSAVQAAVALYSIRKAALPKAGVKALPAPDMVKHHIFNVFRGRSPKSQKYREFFKKHGIKLDNHTVKLTVSEHKAVHKAGNNWTTQWKNWIDANPNATTKEVYQQAGRMMDKHGISHKPIVKY
ncbi:MAG: RHS repeat-associated core domain-containing protein [Cellvibrionaceae bacterium]